MKTYERRRTFHKCSEKGSGLVDICRLCLCTSHDRQNIFDAPDEVPLPMKIMTCVSVQVWEGDGLPSEICLKCLIQLDTIFKFRQRCQEANNKLHDIARKLEVQQPQMMISDSSEERSKGRVSLTHVESQRTPCVSSPLASEFRGEDDNTVVVSSCNSPVHNTSVITAGQTDLSETTIYLADKMEYSAEKIISSNMCSSKTRIEECNVQLSGLLVEEGQNQSESSSAHDSCEGKVVHSGSLSHSTGQYNAENSDNSQVQNISNCSVFKCEKCLKCFSKRIDLRRHSSVHEGQRGFVCSVCEKWFPDKANFKRHERVHTGERPFCCSHCQKCFSQSSILSRHLMTHKGEKPYKCEMCSKSFIQKYALEMHVRRHVNVDVQEFPCPLCNKAFCHESGLSRHLLAHTGKTFDCSICSKSFSDQSSQKRHSKRHAGKTKKTSVMLQ